MARIVPRLWAGFIALIVLTIGMSAQAQTPPPASAFQWEMRDIELSPDGQYLSVIQPFEGRAALAIYRLGGGEPVVIEPGERTQGEFLTVTNHFWSGDRIVIEIEWNYHYRSRYANFWTKQARMVSVNPDGTDTQVFFESRQDSAEDLQYETNIVDVLEDEPDYILISLWDWVENTGFRTVHKVNIRTGRSVSVGRGSRDTNSWATDSDGNVVARLDDVEGELRLLVRDVGSLNWRTLFRQREFEGEGQSNIAPIAVVDGKLYVRSNHEGRNGVYAIDMATGGGLERVFLHDTVDSGVFDYSTQDDKILSVEYWVHGPAWHFFDEEEERFHNMINNALPGEYEEVVESSDDETLHIIASYGPADPVVYYLMNTSEGTISEIGQQYPGLSPDNLGDISVVTYQARDGLEISGYLVLPPGASADDGPFPFVLYPHGGPNARDTITFDGLRQFIATRGYAVFAPNFRGSRGFGNEFMAQGFGEFGGKMQDDLVDGVQHLIDQGIADPNHMCIVGWSYSAYAAIYAAADTPDLFNCAVGVNGVYDLPGMIGDLTTSRAYGALRFWRASMGSDEAQLVQVSPNRRVDTIRAPVLLIASEEDHIVPVEETRRLMQTMRLANRSFDQEIFEYGDHSMNYRPSRIATYEAIERFLAEHM